MKTCFKCGASKSLDGFYAHPGMADGRLNKCKECTKQDAAARRIESAKYIQQYERERNQQPERRRNKLLYEKNSRRRDPTKSRARTALKRAVREGKIQRGHCGAATGIQGHHTDYTKALDVVWVCFTCHREKEHGQKVLA